ncbi:30S ribosomal protein S15 [candidate division WOR-3 bacterium JGI_Cruoil_03_44_89]|uniref:Small ribosomal subunit protein uS15 n=1 Tax=candidate division WOR-3 bacterium JGI_Cruoil_03_44_89 TaxID=1973748 RepID=A0A235BS96_UNCW3|nr:MAG: 30S ribosomal protein S15 [candidate division WOR-3 bacterium JGI_Cruoil_03_44_89]
MEKNGKQKIMKKFRIHKNDSGSPDVQIALLTHQITTLQEHFKRHPKDVHSRVGLIKMVNRRRKLLNYLLRKDSKRYYTVIKKLGLRK